MRKALGADFGVGTSGIIEHTAKQSRGTGKRNSAKNCSTGRVQIYIADCTAIERNLIT